MKPRSPWLWVGVLSLAVETAAFADGVVVFNEILYHPATNGPADEWLELHNQMAVDVELSGWSLSGGVQFRFPDGTVIPGGGYLVVAASPADLARATGLSNILGPFTGRLSGSGDDLRLVNNNGRLMDQVAYGVDGDWPVGPDGSGASLAKRDENSASALASNWTVSALTGGTPGKPNFASQPFELADSLPVRFNSTWRFSTAAAGVADAWNQPEFDDTVWASGEALFAGTDASPPLSDPQPIPTVFSSGMGNSGKVLAPGSADPHYLLTQSAQSTPAPLPLPATVIENHPAWAANDAGSSWIGVVNPGTANVAAGAYAYRTRFNLDGFQPETAALTMSVGADNRLNSVLLNGASKNISYVDFSTLSSPFEIRDGFVPGTNTLDFLTANDTTSPNPAGFRVQLQGLARKVSEVKTTLADVPATSYFRASFTLNGAPQLTSAQLSGVVADGAVFYLNGREVSRVNLPNGPVSSTTLALSNPVNPAQVGPLPLPNAALRAGSNVLAVEVHRGPGRSNTVLFGAELSLTATNILVPPPVTLALNELSPAPNNADSWVELINFGPTPVDLAGCVLARHSSTGTAEYVFPAQVLAPNAFVVVREGVTGFGLQPGDRLFLYSPSRSSVLDAVVAKAAARGRSPDGTGPWCFPAPLTPGAPNEFVWRREVVINEIMYHAPALPGSAQPGAVTPVDSWLELFNRSSQAVDLAGWRLARDIDYAFPTGATLPPQGYLVVAKDVSFMRTNYPGVPVLGPFRKNLGRKGGLVRLLDPAGNTASQVEYFDARPWPAYAAGGGSSLELRDPSADNSKPEAWAASLESSRSGWSNYTYRAVASNNLGPTVWKEFVIGLLEAGECLVDDLSVVENPSGAAVSMLQNGSFETGLAAWRALGNHSASRVELDPDDPNNHVLHLVATGATEHLHNHLETTLANGLSVVNGREYQVSYRAKWLAGNNRLNTRLYFNRVARTTVLPVPAQHGTPGQPNSRLESNIGPTFSCFGHSPVIPKPNEPITVTAGVGDPQTVRSVTLWWSTDRVNWNTSPMLPGSAAAATPPGYTNYVATLPGLPKATLVQFYVLATDGLGATAFYPAAGPASRALFKVDDGKPVLSQLHRLRLWMTPADAAFLHAPTNVMSNDHLGLTLVYDEQQVFYDVGVHLQSSERGRNETSRVGFSVRLNSDQLFRGVQNTLTIDRSGGYSGLGGRHDEILLWHALNHAGGLLGLNCDLVQCFAPRAQEDGTGMLRVSTFDSDYFDAQFDHGSDGNLFKLELIYYPTTTATGNPQAPKMPQPDNVLNVEIQNRGDDPENYRWILLQENHAAQDDYSQIIALNKAFSLTGAALEAQTSALLDADEWMRALAFKAFTGDVDTFTYGLNHNWVIYFRPPDGKALGLLWDMDFSFAQPVTYASPGTGSANMNKVTRLPNNLRRFYSHILDLSTTTMNAAYLRPWAAHYSGLLGQDWSRLVTYLQQRADFLRRNLPLNTPLAITSNGGQDFDAGTNRVALTGTAPLTVSGLLVNGIPFPPTWTSLTNWTLTLPLSGYTNLLVLQGVDHQGNVLGNSSASITVSNTAAAGLQPVVINEWMAANSAPGGFPNPTDGAYADWFELFNPNPVAVDLGGFYLTDTLSQPGKWQIPALTRIPPQGFLLAWADDAADLNGLDPNGDLHVGFQLSKSGDALGLFGPDGTPQHTVSFGLQVSNVSQGSFPDGNTQAIYPMPDWTPGAPNRIGPLPSPRIAAAPLDPAGKVSLLVQAVPGRTYRFEYSDQLPPASWLPVGVDLVAESEWLTLVDAANGAPQRFYRVVLLP